MLILNSDVQTVCEGNCRSNNLFAWDSLYAAMAEEDEEVVCEGRNWPWLLVEKTKLIWPSSTSVIVCGERRAERFSDLSLLYSPLLQQFGNWGIASSYTDAK